MPLLGSFGTASAKALGEGALNTLSFSYPITQFSIGSSSTVDTPVITGGYYSQAKTFSLVSGALPAGMTLDTTTGVLTGPNAWNFAANQATGSGVIGVGAATSVAATSDGGAIVAGYFTGNSITFGSTTLSLAGTNTLFVAKLTNAGVWSWAATNTGSGSVAPQNPAIVVTSDGGAIVTSYFTGNSVTFGSTTLALAGSSSNTVFAAKVSNAGSWSWAATNTASVYNVGVSTVPVVAVGTSDGGALISTYYSGPSSGTLTFGTSAVTVSASSKAYVLAAKISSTGSWSWAATSTGTMSGDNTSGVSIAASGDDGAVISGTFSNTSATATFGTTTVTATAATSPFIAKVSSAGAWSWAAGFAAGLVSGMPTALTATSDGGFIFAVGFSSAAITVGSTGFTGLTGGATNLVLGKLTSAGAWSWATVNTNTTNSGISTLRIVLAATNDGGAVVCVKITSTTFTLGSIAVTFVSASPLVARISSGGVWQWVNGITAGATGTSSFGMAANLDGSAVLTGTFSTGTTLTIGSTSLTRASGGAPAFVAKISSAGSWQWAVINSDATTINTANNVALLATSDGGAMVFPLFTSASSAYGSTTLTLGGSPTLAAVKVDPSGAYGSSSQSPQGFSASITVSATDASGVATTSPTITAA